MPACSQDAPILTVSQITNAIKHCLENTFPSIWIQGEISNCKLHTSGHLYFSIKDERAQIAAVMFRGQASALEKMPKDGDQVILYGSINVYPPSGRYQIQVSQLRFVGLGELLLKLEELKKKLHKRGWFSKKYKKNIPKFPQKIGVVTSPTGAVIQDILHILSRRFAGFHVILNPVRVQGEGAAAEIAKAIRQFDEMQTVDVMIIGRGGGSIEDLWAFNEELVAEAIFNCTIPTICCVGHETDHCIAEYVADVRAPTPSAAAEIVIAEKSQQLKSLVQYQNRIDHFIVTLIRHLAAKREGILKHPIVRNPYLLLGTWMQKLDDTRQTIETTVKQICKNKWVLLEGRKRLLYSLNPEMQILNMKKKLIELTKQLDRYMLQRLSFQSERLSRVVSGLQAVDPKNLLAKGYSILLLEKDNSVIKSVRQTTLSDRLRLMLSDGELNAEVRGIFPSNEKQ